MTPAEALEKMLPAWRAGLPADYAADFIDAVQAELKQGKALGARLLVHGERGAHLLLVESIDLARAERNYVVLHTPLNPADKDAEATSRFGGKTVMKRPAQPMLHRRVQAA